MSTPAIANPTRRHGAGLSGCDLETGGLSNLAGRTALVPVAPILHEVRHSAPPLRDARILGRRTLRDVPVLAAGRAAGNPPVAGKPKYRPAENFFLGPPPAIALDPPLPAITTP